MIEDSEWSLNQALYFSPLVYRDGTVKREDGKLVTGRQKEQAKEGIVLFSDADDAQPGDWAIEPSIAIESSPNRWHCYWILDKAYPALDIVEMNRKMAYATRSDGADLSGWHLTKLLLVPGSMNTKIDRSTGKLVHPDRPIVKGYSTGKKYTFADFEKVYGEVQVAPIIQTSDEEMPTELLDFATVYSKLPETTSTGSDFNELVFTEVWLDSNNRKIGDRSSARFLLLCELFREGLTTQEVMTIAWAAKSSDKWKEDSRGISGLWSEAVRAKAVVDLENGVGIADDDEVYQESRAGIALLTDAERKLVESDVNFITTYEDWAKWRLTKANLPYHRLNAWMVLSCALAPCATIPDEARDVPLNFYGLIAGDSGTGKGDAKTMFHEMLEECVPGGFNAEDGINIGANASSSALGSELIKRDGLVSLLQSDEAHGVLKVMRDQAWQSGGLELWTELFDGDVPKMLRIQNKEASNKAAKTIFEVWLMGTMDGMRKVLTTEMFESGFLPRFIFAIGDPPMETKESMIPRERTKEDTERGFDVFVRQSAREFQAIRAGFKEIHGSRKAPIHSDQDALDRLGEASWAIFQFLDGHRNRHVLKIAQRRIGMSIRKAAALLAIYEQSPTVTLRHVLIALGAAEEWLENLIILADEISASDWARESDEIEAYIRNAGGSATVAAVNRAFRDRPESVRNQQLSDLTSQGRIKRGRRGKTQTWELT